LILPFPSPAAEEPAASEDQAREASPKMGLGLVRARNLGRTVIVAAPPVPSFAKAMSTDYRES
jgi:hypothetical protein